MKIFDVKGKLIKYLAKKQLLSAEGFYKWDGTNEEGAKARIGIYVVLIEISDVNRNISIEKMTCVLAGEL